MNYTIERAVVMIELLNAGDRLVAIQFRRKAGSSFLFYNAFKEIKAAYEKYDPSAGNMELS